jgi:hypothetical protein
MQAFVLEKGINFPYLWDVTQAVAQAFGAQKIPHVFLVNQAGVLCYSGAIDDNAQDMRAVSQPFLRLAIAQILNGQPVPTAVTAPVGCTVKWRV